MPKDFNFLFSYGVTAKNQLNTFHNIYTRDLIDSGQVSIPFVLPVRQKEIIWKEMLEMDFFAYPDTFVTNLSKDAITAMPSWQFAFLVRHNSALKRLYWRDRSTSSDPQAVRLRRLISLIQTAVDTTSEYRALPDPTGGYM
jgi:hypothetical protein